MTAILLIRIYARIVECKTLDPLNVYNFNKMEYLNWILAVVSTLCGGGTVITLFLFRRQQKRFKNAEAFEKEVQALQNTIDSLQKQVNWQEERLNDMQKLLIGKDAYIAEISREKHTLEIKHARNKSAINKAYECPNRAKCKDDPDSFCPVLMQRKQNEEEYLKEISKEK